MPSTGNNLAKYSFLVKPSLLEQNLQLLLLSQHNPYQQERVLLATDKHFKPWRLS